MPKSRPAPHRPTRWAWARTKSRRSLCSRRGRRRGCRRWAGCPPVCPPVCRRAEHLRECRRAEHRRWARRRDHLRKELRLRKALRRRAATSSYRKAANRRWAKADAKWLRPATPRATSGRERQPGVSGGVTARTGPPMGRSRRRVPGDVDTSYWERALSDCERAERNWRTRGREIVRMYRGDIPISRPKASKVGRSYTYAGPQNSSSFNILYANTEVMLPAACSQPPDPVVRSRFVKKSAVPSLPPPMPMPMVPPIMPPQGGGMAGPPSPLPPGAGPPGEPMAMGGPGGTSSANGSARRPDAPAPTSRWPPTPAPSPGDLPGAGAPPMSIGGAPPCRRRPCR